MKKMLGKRFMFLVALLVGLCMPTMAQTTDNLLKIAGLVPSVDGKTMYYLKNVGSGFFMGYGGAWGTQCAEAQAAHVVALENTDGGMVAIANHGGYLGSNELWMDYPKTESNWKLVKAEGYTNQYYLYAYAANEDGTYTERGVLSSIGNKAGVLTVKANQQKALQRWVFITDEDLKQNKMPNATVNEPLDVSPFIRGGAFDYADGWVPAPNTSSVFEQMMPYDKTYWGEDYTSIRKGFAESGFREWDPYLYNYSGILNGSKNAIEVDYVLNLPAGLYHFSCEGFYQCKQEVSTQKQTRTKTWKNKKWQYGNWQNSGNPTVSIQNVDMNAFVEIVAAGVRDASILLARNDAPSYDDGAAIAAVFRDNDDFEQEIPFYLGGNTQVRIRVVRDALTDPAPITNSVSDTEQNIVTTKYLDSYKYKIGETEFTAGGNQISFDNFCLYYSKMPDGLNAPTLESNPPFVVESYEEWFSRYGFFGGVALTLLSGYNYPLYLSSDWNSSFWTIGNNVISKDVYDGQYEAFKADSTRYETEMAAFDQTLNALIEDIDKNVIFQNYIEANIEEYKKVLGNVGVAEFVSKLTEFGVNPSNIDSRIDYFTAIEKMELAFEYAKVAENKTNGAIFNPSFELGTLPDGTPIGWNTLKKSHDTQVVSNYHGTYATDGADGDFIFNTWWQGTPITQDVEGLPEGTYLLSALLASNDNGNRATVYLIANGNNLTYKRGVNPPNDVKGDNGGNEAGSFGDFSLKCEVGSDKKLTVGAVGGDDDDTEDNPIGSYNENGHWWYKCDNFRLEFLPNHILTFKDEDYNIKNIIDNFVGVRVMRKFKPGTNWSTIVLPFSMPIPNGWDVREYAGLEKRTADDGVDELKLTFKKVTGTMEAGKPYLFRSSNEASDELLSEPTGGLDVNTTIKNDAQLDVDDYNVEFVGVYTNGVIPASAISNDEEVSDINAGPQYYFISSNKFYRSVTGTNAIKGFRAYFKVSLKEGAGVKKLRSLSMEAADETIIETAESSEPTVVAIYDVTGVRLDETKPGINILRMSDGTTKKVLVK